MSLLMISTDRGLFDPNSRVSERFRQYSTIFDKLDVIVFSTKNIEQIKLTDKVTIYSTNSSDRFRYFADAKRISRQLNPEIVSAQDPFLTGFTAYKISKIHNALFHLQIHTDIFNKDFKHHNLKNYFFALMAKYLLPKADGIRVVSERIADSIKDLKLKVEPIVLPIRVDLPESFESVSFPFEKTILSVSRLESEKNIELTIDAFNIVRKNYKEVGLVIVGEGSLRKSLEEKVRSLDLQDSVLFIGGKVDVFGYYLGADIYLQTSIYEGYGMALIEAALSGLAIVTTDVGVVGDVLIDGSSCLVVKKDKNDVAERIKNLLNNNDLVNSLGEKAKEVAGRHIMSEEIYLEAYKKAFNL